MNTLTPAQRRALQFWFNAHGDLVHIVLGADYKTWCELEDLGYVSHEFGSRAHCHITDAGRYALAESLRDGRVDVRSRERPPP